MFRRTKPLHHSRRIVEDRQFIAAGALHIRFHTTPPIFGCYLSGTLRIGDLDGVLVGFLEIAMWYDRKHNGFCEWALHIENFRGRPSAQGRLLIFIDLMVKWLVCEWRKVWTRTLRLRLVRATPGCEFNDCHGSIGLRLREVWMPKSKGTCSQVISKSEAGTDDLERRHPGRLSDAPFFQFCSKEVVIILV